MLDKRRFNAIFIKLNSYQFSLMYLSSSFAATFYSQKSSCYDEK